MSSIDLFQEMQKELQSLEALEILERLNHVFGSRAALSSSFGAEDQVLTHMLRKNDSFIRIFALDTGRNFEETYYTMAMTMSKYRNIELFAPEASDIEDLILRKGPLSFYESVENRKECCYIRKVKPLKRALKGVECWITGIRREHSENRNEMEIVEWDPENQCIKVHPLFNWKTDDVWAFINGNSVPYNELHKKNYPSIGCAPCTRAIKPGEEFRAGRWWWEKGNQECGLHVSLERKQS